MKRHYLFFSFIMGLLLLLGCEDSIQKETLLEQSDVDHQPLIFVKGETFTLQKNKKDTLDVALVDMEVIEGRNEYDTKTFDTVVKFTLDATNLTDEPIKFDSSFMKFYGKNEEPLDYYQVSGLDLDTSLSSEITIAPGRHGKIRFYIGIIEGDTLHIAINHLDQTTPFATLDVTKQTNTVFKEPTPSATYLEEISYNDPFFITPVGLDDEALLENRIKSIVITDERNEFVESIEPSQISQTVAIITIESKNIGTEASYVYTNLIAYDKFGYPAKAYNLITEHDELPYLEPNQVGLHDIVIGLNTEPVFDLEIREENSPNRSASKIFKYRGE